MSIDKSTVSDEALLRDALSKIKQVKQENTALRDELHRRNAEPIAIVGASCRFPGGIFNLDDLWQFLSNGRNAISEIPPDRWSLADFYDPNPQTPGRSHVPFGGFLSNVELFDHVFFDITPREAACLDPQQRLLLELSWEAIEDACLTREKLASWRTGVFLGISASEYLASVPHFDQRDLSGYLLGGTNSSMAAGRLSYFLGLNGPCLSVDTACSTSLVALHVACQAMRQGECDAALVGAVNVMISPRSSIAIAKAGMLSPDGQCKTFSDAANGYARSEGCAVLLLRKLSDALANGDRVLALVRGSAVNQDGGGGGLTVPNGQAQENVIRSALHRAGVRPDDIDFVEAHGTGTALGDPIEMGSLGRVFAQRLRPLPVSSVKANLGHQEICAGMAGVLKAILALRHEALPPQLHIERKNPAIPWESLPLTVETRPLALEGATMAGVNSFGFSGTNAHVILERPVEAQPVPTTETSNHCARQVLLISAKSEAAFLALLQRYNRLLAEVDAETMRSICYTSAIGREHMKFRAAISGSSSKALLAGLEQRLQQPPAGIISQPRLAFMMTGQGSHYEGMGKGLYQACAIFRQHMDDCARRMQHWLGFDVLSVLWGKDALLMQDTHYAQPAIFALEYCLALRWHDLAVLPDVVLGHSIGEYAAACLAGVFSLDDAIRLIGLRGRLSALEAEPGGMMVLFASTDTVRKLLEEMRIDLSIAAENGPANTVLSGYGAAIAQMQEAAAAKGIRHHRLEVNRAFHSSLMTPMLSKFAELARSIDYRMPELAFISTVTGQQVSSEIACAEYWIEHITATVRFSSAINTLATTGIHFALEVGPSNVLVGMARQVDSADAVQWLTSLQRGCEDWSVQSDTVAALYEAGVNLDWAAYYREAEVKRVQLPTYPFQRTAFHLPCSANDHARVSMKAQAAPAILGQRLDSPLPIYQQRIAFDTDFLVDHRVRGAVVVPGSYWLSMAQAAGNGLSGDKLPVLSDIEFVTPMVLEYGGDARDVQMLVSDGHPREFRICQRTESNEQEWQVLSRGCLQPEADPLRDELTLAETAALCSQSLDPQMVYARYASQGLVYGGAFRTLREIRFGPECALAKVVLDPATIELDPTRRLPMALDACFQLSGALNQGREMTQQWLPAALESMCLSQADLAEFWCFARLRSKTNDHAIVDFWLFEEKRCVGRLSGLRLQTVHALSSSENFLGAEQDQYELRWQASKPMTAATGVQGEHWIVLAGPEFGATLAAAMQASGASLTLVLKGDRCHRVDDTTLMIDPCQPQHYAWLFEELKEQRLNHVVHAWAVDEQIWDDDWSAQQQRLCGSLLHLAQGLQAEPRRTRLSIVTRHAQAVTDDVDLMHAAAGSMWGFARSLIAELPQLNCRAVDWDGASPIELLRNELCGYDDENLVAYRDASRYVLRVERQRSHAAQTEAGNLQKPAKTGSYALQAAERGHYEKLAYVPTSTRDPGPGEVAIEVLATGLNFIDVLNVLGRLPVDPPPPLGLECCGRVTALGEGITHVQPGDLVMALAPGCLGDTVITTAKGVVRKPAHMNPAEAASVPTVYATAYICLHRFARIQPGDKVLIHAGAGGVGLAAIAIAQAAGAEVFATASRRKHRYLSALGVKNLYDSRSIDFAQAVLADTHGRGVDVVLNSLAGDFIEKSFDALALGGRFAEIGKTGVWSAEKVASVRPDVRYAIIDLLQIGRDDPQQLFETLQLLVERLERGDYRTLPYRSYAYSEVDQAMRYLSQGKNIGKVVVEFSPPPRRALRKDGVYLLTGGLGALGLLVARSLASLGAGHLVLCSRRAPEGLAKARVDEAIRSIEALGARVCVHYADVADAKAVEDMIAVCTRDGKAIRGVVHCAGVLDDGVIGKQSWDRFHKVMSAKVAGAWNLHRCTLKQPLEFFVLFSSASSLFFSPGQSNYASANAFLDTLSHFRRRLGLPALSINWGAWKNSGMAAGTTVANNVSRSGGSAQINLTHGMYALEALLFSTARQVGIVPLDWQSLTSNAANSRPIQPLLKSLLGAEPQGSNTARAMLDRLLEDIEQAQPDLRGEKIRLLVAQQVAKVMSLSSVQELDQNQPLHNMGLDSLMAVELRNSLNSLFASRLSKPMPANLLFEHPTVTALANYIYESGFAAFEVSTETSGPDEFAENRVIHDRTSSLDLVTNGHAIAVSRQTDTYIVRMMHGAADARPVFFVHAIDGAIGAYMPLAQLIGEERSFYAFQRPFDYSDELRFKPIEEMAKDYVQSLRRIQPEGPYLLGGWSMGGLIALEMAQQLVKQGHEVAHLTMIDVHMPTLAALQEHHRDETFDRQLFAIAHRMPLSLLDRKTLQESSESELIAYLHHLGVSNGILNADLTRDELHAMFRLMRFNAKALRNYLPSPYAHPVSYMKADAEALTDASDWSPYLSQMEAITVPGDHFTIMNASGAEKITLHLFEAYHRSSSNGMDAIFQSGMKVPK